MGADLISYILVGPEKLKASAKATKAMLARGETLVALAKRVVDESLDYDDLTEKEQDLVGTLEYEDLVNYVFDLDPSTVLAEFLSLWKNADARDCSARLFDVPSKTKGGRRQCFQILVAGDMSWGDEPEGAGYQTIKAALILGFPCQFGVR